MKMNPKGSNCIILSREVSAGLTGDGVFGVRNRRKANDRAPRGTLIQKHQRHVTAVKYPLRIGAVIDANPNIALRPPLYLGRDCSGTMMLISMKAPHAIPAPPIPAIARPTMRALEVGAVAQTIDPVSNTATSMKRTDFAE